MTINHVIANSIKSANLLRPIKEQPKLAPIPVQANAAIIAWPRECVQAVWREWLQMYRHFALDDALYQHKVQYGQVRMGSIYRHRSDTCHLQQVITCFSYLSSHADPESGLVLLIELLTELRDHLEPVVLRGALQSLLLLSGATWHGPGTPITALLTLCFALAQHSDDKTLLSEAMALLFAAPSPIDAVSLFGCATAR